MRSIAVKSVAVGLQAAGGPYAPQNVGENQRHNGTGPSVGNCPTRTDILYTRHVVRQSRGGEGPRDFLPSCLRTKRANRSWGRGPVPAEILRSCDSRGERHLWSDTALISIGAHAGSTPSVANQRCGWACGGSLD